MASTIPFRSFNLMEVGEVYKDSKGDRWVKCSCGQVNQLCRGDTVCSGTKDGEDCEKMWNACGDRLRPQREWAEGGDY